MVTWKDERPPLEQVKSGFKIVGAMLLCLAAFLLFSKSYALLSGNRDGPVTLGWILLCIEVGALFVTVRYWARIFFSVIAYCALRSTILVVLAVVGIARDISLLATVVLSVCLWGMTAFTYRFHDQKVFSIVEQIALTTAVMLLFLALLKIGTFGVHGSLTPFAIALLALALPASAGLKKRHTA